MAARRVLVVLTVDSGRNEDCCGRCRFLGGAHLPHCQLFGEVLDQDGRGRELRDEACLAAERNYSNLAKAVL